MDEELKRFLDEAAEQRARVRELKTKQAWGAIEALKQRQSLESLGRWVINKCLIAGVKFK
jgi:hypothetical protein